MILSTSKPDALRELSSRLGGVRDRAAKLRDFSEAQLNWRPGEGQWSTGECAIHVRDVNVRYEPTLAKAIEAGRRRGQLAEGPFKYGWFGKLFYSFVSPESSRKLKAPKLFVPDQETVSQGDVASFLNSFDSLDRLIESSQGLDLAKIKAASPVSGLLKFQLGVALSFLVAHTDRHVGQFERVVASPGFPKE